MIDTLALPVLAATIVGFLIYIWAAWLRDPKGRSLRIPGDDDDDERPFRRG
jgi:hypothetical protein